MLALSRAGVAQGNESLMGVGGGGGKGASRNSMEAAAAGWTAWRRGLLLPQKLVHQVNS